MNFYIAMFILNLLIPVLMIVSGYCMYKNPPRNINGTVGYRTKMSKKNMDTWNFAHDYCGRLWLKLGIIMVVPSILVQVPFAHVSNDIFGTISLIIEGVQVVIMLISTVFVEKALKNNFDENGVRI